jgi:nicotinate-nucleotide adenylyltransferase
LIGLFGGTFDPVHLGHLRLALEVCEQLDLAQLRFIPLHQAVHKKQPAASAQQRADMLRLAIADVPDFQVETMELDRQGPSYTRDSLRQLRQRLGEREPLLWILGSDAFRGFLGWKAPREILGLAHLVVLGRPHAEPYDDALLQCLAQHRAQRPQDLSAAPAGRILQLQLSLLAISSSDIRNRCRRGLDCRFLVPDAVRDYLLRNRLYHPADSASRA